MAPQQDIVDAYTVFLLAKLTSQVHARLLEKTIAAKPETLPFQADLDRLKEALGDSDPTGLFLAVLVWLIFTPEDADEQLRLLVRMDVFPLLMSTWKLRGFSDWPRLAWHTVSSALDNAVLLEGCLSLMSRLLAMFLPWASKDKIDSALFEASHFDIRQEDGLVQMILDGLNHHDASARKGALFVLKMTVKFSTHHRTSPAVSGGGLQLFCWPDDRIASLWSHKWSDFCLLYETMQETQVHLIEPILPLLDSLLRPSAEGVWLGMPWWECVVARAFDNSSVSVRRLVLSAIVSLDLKSLPALRSSVPFLFGPLLYILGNSFLYTAADTAKGTSSFGDAVVEFYTGFIESFEDRDDRRRSIRFYLSQIAEHLIGAVSMIYLVQPLMRIPPTPSLGSSDLQQLESLALNRSFHNRKARRLFRWQLLQVLVNLVDPEEVAFDRLALLTSLLVEDLDVQLESAEHQRYSAWLLKSFGPDYVRNNIQLAIERALSLGHDLGALQRLAKIASTMICFLLGNSDAYLFCVSPIMQGFALLDEGCSMAELLALCSLMVSFEAAIQRTSSKSFARLLDVDARLLKVASCIQQFTVGKAVQTHDANCSWCVEPEALRVFLAAFALCLSSCTSADVKAYVDMLCIHLVQWIDLFYRSEDVPKSGTFETQVVKTAVFSLLNIALATVLDRQLAPPAILGGMLDKILAVELDRPSEISEEQWTAWPELCAKFNVDKYALMGRLAVTLKCTDAIIAKLLVYCLQSLPDSKYNSTVALVKCMRELLAIEMQVQLMARICDALQGLVDDRNESSKWLKSYACAAIDLLCSIPVMACRETTLHGRAGCVRLLLEHLLEVASSRFGYVAVHMSAALHALWLTLPKPDKDAVFIEYSSLMVSLLVYGPSRDLSEDVLAEKLSLTTFHLDSGSFSDDFMARVRQVCILNSLTASDWMLSETLTDRLLSSLALSDQELERHKRTAFPNTHAHRVRLRTWMALLVLTPTLAEARFEQLAGQVARLLVSSEAVPTTRLFAEWWLVLGLCRFPGCIDTVLVAQLKNVTLAAGPLISAINILQHVCLHLDRQPLYSLGLDLLAPWFLHNSAAARMHTFWAFRTLASRCQERRPGYQGVYEMIEGSEHCQRFLSRLADDPLLTVFDPIGMFSLEAIFGTVPRLTRVIADDEFIPVKAFSVSCEAAGSVPLTCPIGLPPDVQPGALNSTKEQGDRAGSSVFQKKISPLDTDLDELSLDPTTAVSKARSGLPAASSIIVIASLLDRIPNMAGLCRTAEIFAAAALVLPDLKVVASKDFQTVCMTSDRWIALSEVQPSDLSEYLATQRSDGYAIVVLEQSSRSQPLQKYRFPEKFCLLLGNEREGVPADLLHLCDVCLEIPQFGVVRSLNVHVAGSLVLWEARRQQLEASSDQ